MSASAEFLWCLNRDYVNRLVKARNALGLLEHVLLTRASAEVQTQLLPTVQFARSYLSRLSDAHRAWCYNYFYESAETKRVVQSARAVQQALVSFDQTRQQHGSLFGELAARLNQLPPPAAGLTALPHDDLWQMAQRALRDMSEMDSSLGE
jgi:hypothetical protein